MSNEIQQIIMYRDPVEAPVGEREAVSRAICSACEEGPDHPGCEPGNKYRWQDYLSVADAAISAYQRAPQPHSAEAVAWTWQGALDQLKGYCPEGVAVFGHKGPGVPIPLYTTPQPSAGVVMPDWKGFSERLMDFITYAGVSSGVCCCGDYMQGHADPMASGHSPVDMWDSAVLEFGREFARLNGKEVGRG